MTAVELTSPGRVLWPATGYTKGEMLDYYRAVAPAMLPHLRDRPVTLRRFPEGVDQPGWYQTNCRGAPSWLRTVEVRGGSGAGQRYCVVDDLDGLLWAANLGAIEFHPLPTRVHEIGEPAALVLDLDPGPPATIADCARIALRLRTRLRDDGLEPVVKTSGVSGLHVVAGLERGQSFAAAKAYARRLAHAFAAATPDQVVDRADRAARTGRIYIDWIQNALVRSIVAPYSLRALELPLGSTPLSWAEVEQAAAGNRIHRLWFGPDEILARVTAMGDLFAGAMARTGRLPAADPT